LFERFTSLAASVVTAVDEPERLAVNVVAFKYSTQIAKRLLLRRRFGRPAGGVRTKVKPMNV